MSAGKKAKKNASNQSGGSIEEDGVDLSTAAELWSEDELRQLIREEALKLLMGQQQQGITGQQIMPNVPTYPQPSVPQPSWTTTWGTRWTTSCGPSNHLYDGHSTVNCNSGDLVGASS